MDLTTYEAEISYMARALSLAADSAHFDGDEELARKLDNEAATLEAQLSDLRNDHTDRS
jgi:hypothetical protein